MKVVDPQSALLTNAEVYDFLKSHKPRPADKKIGAYEPVKLDGYKKVCEDVRSLVLIFIYFLLSWEFLTRRLN